MQFFLPYLLRWCYAILDDSLRVSWFTSFQEGHILNASLSSLELSWYRFHLKPSIGNVANCGAYHWSKLSPYPSRWKKFSSLLWSQTSNCFSLVAKFHLKCWDVSISPLQAYSFRCWFSNNPVITFSEGCFPSSFVAEVGIFSYILLFQWSIFYSLFRRHCDVALFDPSSCFVKIMFFYCLPV